MTIYKDLGLNSTELSRYLGISKSGTVHRVNGKKAFTDKELSTLKQIADARCVDLTPFFQKHEQDQRRIEDAKKKATFKNFHKADA